MHHMVFNRGIRVLILFMKIEEKWRGNFDFSVTSQNLMESLLWILSAIYAPCSVQTNCSDVARIPRKSSKSIFSVFDHTFFSANKFRFLIEYPFKSNKPITVIYTHVRPISSAKRLTPGCPDSEKIDPNQYFSFDDTFFTTNDFRFLIHVIEYPLKSNLPITVIYTHVRSIPSGKGLMPACLDSEKKYLIS